MWFLKITHHLEVDAGSAHIMMNIQILLISNNGYLRSVPQNKRQVANF